MVKHLLTMWETQVQSLGGEDPLEKEMATHSSTLAGKSHGRRSVVGYIPWGRKELDTTEQFHFHFQSSYVSFLTSNLKEPKNFNYIILGSKLHLNTIST